MTKTMKPADQVRHEVSRLIEVEPMEMDVNLINNTLYFIQATQKTYTYDLETKILEEGTSVGTESSTNVCCLTPDEKNKIAKENMTLIHYVLKGLNNTGIDYDELESVAYVGFAKALDTFDKLKGVRFATYAVNCITNEVFFFLRKEKKHLLFDVSLQKEYNNDSKGKAVTLEETLEDVNFSKKGIDGNLIHEENANSLLRAISRLDETEQYIMLHRYGINKNEEKTQKQLAEELNMSQANISKIQKTCLKKLKLFLHKEM